MDCAECTAYITMLLGIGVGVGVGDGVDDAAIVVAIAVAAYHDDSFLYLAL